MILRRTRGLRLVLAAIPGWSWPAIGIVLLWLGIGLYLAHEHRQTLDEARTNGTNLARAFRELMLRTIHEIDQTLLFVRALHTREGGRLDLRPWVEGAGPEMRLALQIATTDRNGLMTLSNLRPITERIDLSDRPHFRYFADQPPDAPLRDHLFVSVPVLGRVSQAWTIQFVRMLKTQTGDFDGMVVLSVPPGYLTQFYSAIDLGKQGSVTLLGLDRVIRARAGPGIAPIGTRSPPPRSRRRNRPPKAASTGPTRLTAPGGSRTMPAFPAIPWSSPSASPGRRCSPPGRKPSRSWSRSAAE